MEQLSISTAAMPQRRVEDTEEWQPLVAADAGDQDGAAAGAAAAQRGATGPALSAGTGGAGEPTAPPAGGSRQASAEPVPACRICLQEDGDETLESGICSCSGSMQVQLSACSLLMSCAVSTSPRRSCPP